MMHRARDLLIRQRTMLVNALRGHLAEFGLVAAQGLHKAAELMAIVRDDADERVPALARQVLRVMASQIADLQTRTAALEAQIPTWHKSNPTSQRLATIPGVGPIIATAITGTVPDPGVFRSGREFAACSASCQDRTPRVVRTVSVGSASEAMATLDACWSAGRMPCSFARKRVGPILGWSRCRPQTHASSWPLLWRTKRRAWLGPS
jgi:transposase